MAVARKRAAALNLDRFPKVDELVPQELWPAEMLKPDHSPKVDELVSQEL